MGQYAINRKEHAVYKENALGRSSKKNAALRGVAELAQATDLKSVGALLLVGSNPTAPTYDQWLLMS